MKNKKMCNDFYENIITKNIEIKVHQKQLIHFLNLNYNIKVNDIITIPIEHLQFGSSKKILVKCNINEISMNNYFVVMKKGFNYKCKKCNTFEYNNKIKYNVANVMELDVFKNKIKETKLKNYGTETYNNQEKCKKTKLEKYNNEYYNNHDKYKETCLDKYGVDNISKLDDVKKQKKETLKSNYGVESMLSFNKTQETKNETVKNKYHVDNVFQLDWVKEKSKRTFLEKYGVENAFQLSNKRYKIKYDERFELYYQGTYEKHFLDFCYINNLKIIKPKYLKYILDNKIHKYFPDFYYEPLNLLIEIKSDYIFELQKDKNIAKLNYSVINGFDHMFIINKQYDEFIKRINTDV